MNNHFTICHWNLNSIFAHNFAKVQLLKAYFAVHKFDIVRLSETYLNSSFPFDDDNLEIPAYIMVRADHPANSKRGGVCMYYKNCLLVTNCVVSFPLTDHLANHLIILYHF